MKNRVYTCMDYDMQNVLESVNRLGIQSVKDLRRFPTLFGRFRDGMESYACKCLKVNGLARETDVNAQEIVWEWLMAELYTTTGANCYGMDQALRMVARSGVGNAMTFICSNVCSFCRTRMDDLLPVAGL